MNLQEEDLDTLAKILEHLRSPQGCPWDREQTHQSIKGAFLEECYEALEAIENGDMDALAEELGDVLVNVLFHAQLAKEAGAFTLGDVIRKASEKLVRRHPHVFGDAKVSDTREVETTWQAIKNQERAGKEMSLLDGTPKTMPALAYSQAIQTRASRSGFDWDHIDGAVAKVIEELDELKEASSPAEKESELGDVFFSLVNMGRWLQLDAESSLRLSNDRFYSRFIHMEKACRQKGISFPDLSMNEKEALWQQAKAWERQQS